MVVNVNPLSMMETHPHYAQAMQKIIDRESQLDEPWDPKKMDIPRWVVENLLVYDQITAMGGGFYTTQYPYEMMEAVIVYRRKHPPTITLSPDMFNPVIGYPDIKKLIYKTLENNESVNWLLAGVPGSAKTLFLMCLEKLQGASMLFGSRTSRAGLVEFMLKNRPRYLLVDELDKMKSDAMSPLLGLAEDGRLVSTLYKKHIDERFGVTVFATANSLKRIPAEVKDRFQVAWFPKYSRDEFLTVCQGLLLAESVSVGVARFIGGEVYDRLDGDIRQAVRVARMAKSVVDVGLVVETLGKYTPEASQ